MKPRRAPHFHVGPHGCRWESSVKIVGHRSHSCNRHRGVAHCGLVCFRLSVPLSFRSSTSRSSFECEPTAPSVRAYPWPSSAIVESEPLVPSLPSVASPLWPPAVPVPSLAHRWLTGVTLACQRRSACAGVTVALRPNAVSPAPTLVRARFPVPSSSLSPNQSFQGTLRDEAAQRP